MRMGCQLGRGRKHRKQFRDLNYALVNHSTTAPISFTAPYFQEKDSLCFASRPLSDQNSFTNTALQHNRTFDAYNVVAKYPYVCWQIYSFWLDHIFPLWFEKDPCQDSVACASRRTCSPQAANLSVVVFFQIQMHPKIVTLCMR
ncbi:hypothetical protein N7G274_004028 [Stereocaulon virgatum]|uniref:Uncharacterized protein n=1 Tax=Stereocaulon virgatum TaxID=373712 RepID=A0ABR4ABT7_9LECA